MHNPTLQIVLGVLAVALVIAGSWIGTSLWQSHHKPGPDCLDQADAAGQVPDQSCLSNFGPQPGDQW